MITKSNKNKKALLGRLMILPAHCTADLLYSL